MDQQPQPRRQPQPSMVVRCRQELTVCTSPAVCASFTATGPLPAASLERYQAHRPLRRGATRLDRARDDGRRS